MAKTAFKKKRPLGVMAAAVGDQIVISWEPVSDAGAYEIFEATETAGKRSKFLMVKRTKHCRIVLMKKAADISYAYCVRACKRAANGIGIYSRKSAVVSTTMTVKGISTIKNFLKTALAPIGSTMYVWGGGWDETDTGAGMDARRIGLRPAWRSFARGKTASYNYADHRYEIHKGLDCSGYVGWAVYNVLNTDDHGMGYVFPASEQAKKFSGFGFGSYRSADRVTDHQAGDIMSSACHCCGHVWIVVGPCGDNSVVLLHASPSGVQLNGTVTPEGNKNSQAIRLATKYMKKYYRSWYRRFPQMDRGVTYLGHYGQMRWKTGGNGVILSDPDGLQNMCAEKVLEQLFDR